MRSPYYRQCCSLSGEEFLVVAPNCELGATQEVVEHIRLRVEQYLDSEVGLFTISLGVAQAAVDESLSSLIERADKALYQAEEAGRNCVSLAF